MKHHPKRSEETSADVAAPETDAEVRRAPTEPWKAENAPNSPRKRGLLGLAKDKEGHQLRWVRYDSIDRRKMQGYELAKPEEFDATPDENGMIRRNELVLMTVPNEIYEQRRADVAAFTKQQSAAPKREYMREREQASRQAGANLSDERREEE